MRDDERVKSVRLVLDTNIWLDWLLFDDPQVAPIKAAVADGRAEVVIDESVEAELIRVLTYPFGAKTLPAEAQAANLARCRSIATRATSGTNNVEDGSRREEGLLPKCSDPDDQKFLELALACGAAFLVTRDGALLELARHKVRPLPYRIVSPRELARELGAR
jgi:uncharacterized protein